MIGPLGKNVQPTGYHWVSTRIIILLILHRRNRNFRSHTHANGATSFFSSRGWTPNNLTPWHARSSSTLPFGWKITPPCSARRCVPHHRRSTKASRNLGCVAAVTPIFCQLVPGVDCAAEEHLNKHAAPNQSVPSTQEGLQTGVELFKHAVTDPDAWHTMSFSMETKQKKRKEWPALTF